MQYQFFWNYQTTNLGNSSFRRSHIRSSDQCWVYTHGGYEIRLEGNRLGELVCARGAAHGDPECKRVRA